MGSDAVLQREFEKQQQVNQGTKIWEEVFFLKKENEGRRRKKQKKRKTPLTTDACERNCPIGIGNEQKNFDVPKT